jgi:hypothetical protein
MKIDLDYLRQHYASLSDGALAEVNRNELVEAAQKCYDDECKRRGLRDEKHSRKPSKVREPDAQTELRNESEGGDDDAWMDGAACVCSFADEAGANNSPDALAAQDVLQAAGIPSYISTEEIPAAAARAQNEFRVLVPGALNLKASSILDKEIFNAAFEADWKSHFEMLSDEELMQLTPEVICAGLRDRIERLTRAYEQELERRGLDL